jgi:transposase
MQWQHLDLMSQRREFALRALQTDNFRALCKEYGISPRVGYKWKSRLLEEGMRRMEEHSRRRKSTPNALSEEEVCRIVLLRVRHKRWGARKLQEIYQRKHGEAPSESSLKRLFEHYGLPQAIRSDNGAPFSSSRSINGTLQALCLVGSSWDRFTTWSSRPPTG